VKSSLITVTFLAGIAVSAWQSKRLYKKRQADIINDFAATMVARVGDDDDRELLAAIQNFRKQLGPGRYSRTMFVAFLKALAVVKLKVQSIHTVKTAARMMKLSADASILKEVGVDLAENQPSALQKLIFITDRAMPTAASSAKLRTTLDSKIFSAETVDALQGVMLEKLMTEMIEKDPDTMDRTNLQLLGISTTEANRVRDNIKQKRADEEAAELAEQQQRQRIIDIEAEIKRSELENMQAEQSDIEPEAPLTPPPAVDDTPPESRAEGTHEFECTSCGYILFPAAGREFKFFGDDFKCPQCGAGKDEFVDKGVV